MLFQQLFDTHFTSLAKVDPEFVEVGFKQTKEVCFLYFIQFFLNFPMKMK